MQAYHVADAQGLIKLDAMENPFSLPEQIKVEWSEVIKQAAINRYPPPHPELLVEQIAQQFQLPAKQAIMLGNGSDELIQILMLALTGNGKKVLAPEPGFVMYSVTAALTGMEFIGVDRNPDFTIDTKATIAAIREHQPALIFLASPNNPTGNTMPRAELEEILAVAEGLVVVDEAYYIFSDSTHIDLLGQYDNLLLMRTFSKIGLAGLRLGMLMGPSACIHEFDKVRMPYNINILTQVSASFMLEHHSVLQEQAEILMAERSRLQAEMEAISTVEVFPSQANFFCLRLLQHDAADVFGALKEKGILIKKLHGGHSLLENCLRVTVGTEAENNAFLQALSEILA